METVAQGPLSGPAALPPRRELGGAANERIIDYATGQQPLPVEKPQGRKAGPALPHSSTSC